MARSGIHKIERIPLLGGLLPVLCLIIPAQAFMRHQSLWVDETTQLSGLTLGPVELLKWTTGMMNPFQVPNDYSPPISYWMGQIWSMIFGLSELSMRWFALVMVCLAVLVVFEAGRVAFGFKSGLIAALLFALSPNIVEQAVNIRNYPVLLFFSALGFYFLVRTLENPAGDNRKWLAVLTVSSLLAIYTHFFGLILAGSLFLAVFLCVWRSKGPLIPVLVSMFIVGVGSLGLAPFVMAAGKGLGQHLVISGDGYLISVLRLVYRQISHPVLLLSLLTVATAFIGTALLLSINLFLLVKDGSTQRRSIFIALTSGIVVILIGRYAVSGLMTEPHYNLWIQPGLFVFIASALVLSGKKLKILASLAVVIIFGSYVYGDVQLMINGKYFSHTRYSDIKKLVGSYNPTELTLVHTGKWLGALYFPFIYEYGDTVNHFYLEEKDGEEPNLRKPPHLDVKYEIDQIDTKYMIILKTVQSTSKEITNYLHGRGNFVYDEKTDSIIPYLLEWKLIKRDYYLSLGLTDVSIFMKSK